MNFGRLQLNLRDSSEITARFAFTLAIATAAVTLASLLVSLLVSVNTGQYILLVANFVVLLLTLGCALLVRRGYVRAASAVLMVTFMGGALATSITNPLLAALALITAAALASPTVFVVINLLVLGRVGLEAVVFTALNSNAIISGTLNLDVYVSPLFSLTILSLVIRYFITITQGTAQRAQRNAELLQASADIGQAASRLLDTRDLLTQAASLLAARFNYYIVRIYQLNEAGTELVLNADSGETKAQRHGRRVPVEAAASVGQAVLRARPTIVRYTDPGFSRDDWGLHTRSQLALPLLDRERVIGVVDIQSREEDAFAPIDLQALLIVTEVLSSSLRNARLFEQQRATADENQRLYEQSQASLLEIQRLNQELTGQVWSAYTQNSSLGITLEQGSLSPFAEWTDELKQAGTARQPVLQQKGDNGAVVAVPLLLRGEVIGAIEVQPGEDSAPAETLEMVEAVAQRLAVSLENARLYEETTAAAANEQRINDIAARYQEVTTVDELLRITVTELSESLGAVQGAIRLSRVRPEGEGND